MNKHFKKILSIAAGHPFYRFPDTPAPDSHPRHGSQRQIGGEDQEYGNYR